MRASAASELASFPAWVMSRWKHVTNATRFRVPEGASCANSSKTYSGDMLPNPVSSRACIIDSVTPVDAVCFTASAAPESCLPIGSRSSTPAR